MGQRLNRHLGELRSLDPGQWMADPGWPSEGVRREVFVRCPKCGTVHNITDTHKIGMTGRVFGIFACQDPTCPFSDYLELEAWGMESLE